MTVVTEADIDAWADQLDGPVALHMRQVLEPIEQLDGAPGQAVIFPPTYARKENETGSPYNVDKLSDGTKVAQIDSVGSQANRSEPIFIERTGGSKRLSALVPQWWISVPIKAADGSNSNEKRRINLLDVGHRLGDALVRATSLGEEAKNAFDLFSRHGDATRIGKLSPTSLVFGVWDSRGSQAKLPRLVSAVVRAWDVDELRRSAQYFPPINYSEQDIISAEDQIAAEKNPKSKEAQRGMVAVPAVHTHGGIVVRGGITRDVTVNLIALRQLGGGDDQGRSLRRYVLGLSLLAASEPLDAFLRQGCMLTVKENAPGEWCCVRRSGKREPIEFPTDLLDYAEARAAAFGVGEGGEVDFNPDLAIRDLKKDDEKKRGRGKRGGDAGPGSET